MSGYGQQGPYGPGPYGVSLSLREKNLKMGRKWGITTRIHEAAHVALNSNHNSSKGRHHLSSTLLKAHLRDSTRPRDSPRLLPIQLRSIFMPLLVRTARYVSV